MGAQEHRGPSQLRGWYWRERPRLDFMASRFLEPQRSQTYVTFAPVGDRLMLRPMNSATPTRRGGERRTVSSMNRK